MYEVDHRYLKFVDFTQFEKWDVKRHYHKSNVKFSNEVVLLGNILKPYKKGINKEYIINNKLNIISKINFGGELFLRDFEEINTYKGNLFLVPENSIIYSKINVRHGCIYYHQKNETPFAVSNEYPIYTFDEKRIDGRFIQKLIRSNYFKNLLNTKTSGISKARVKQDEFLDIQIPLPSIAEQKTILDDYQQKIENAKQQETKAQILEQSIEKYLFEELGIVEDKSVSKKGLMFFDSKSISEWGTDKILSKSNTFSTLFEIKNLEDSKLTIDIFRGKSPKYSVNSKSLILNQKCNRWNEIDLSFAKNVDDFWYKKVDEKFFTKKNDILINSTGEGTIGRSSLINLNYVNLLYDSHLLLLRLNQNYVDAVFFVNLFNSNFVQSQIDSIKSAQATKQTELGITNLKKISFPLPPLEKQKEIAEHISAIKDNIKSLKQNAETLKAEAEKEFEEKIFN